MRPTDIGFAALAVFSAVMLTYEWLSLYNKVDYTVNFYAGMLVFAMAVLILRR
jgi:hypothetical protein